MTSTPSSLTRPGDGSDQALITPMGMGDLLPPRANARKAMANAVLDGFGRAGYELVTPPLFEYAHVVEKGNDTIDRRDLLRFVEPESGEVAVLRPDITPQVARIVATRMTDRTGPWRLCYEGRVLRRRRGRARSHRQIPQVGVECIGVGSPEGDAEVLSLAMDACNSVGLEGFLLELSDTRLVGAILDGVPDAARDEIAFAVARKDGAQLRSACKQAAVTRGTRRQLEALIEHFGGLDVLAGARDVFRGRVAGAALDNLGDVIRRLTALGLEARVGVDLAETRGLSYYTGLNFRILADGPGEAICGGGRYDNLLARFGAAQPAAGFALDLDNLQWALRAAGQPYRPTRAPRLVVMGGREQQRAQLARELRAAGVTAVTTDARTQTSSLAFARSWGYDALLSRRGSQIRLKRVADGETRDVKLNNVGATGAVARWIRAEKG